jgi:hypothetical protein
VSSLRRLNKLAEVEEVEAGRELSLRKKIK